ncbi:hypothetical protein niasHT_022634 [Heterodera trifolii]|uniref:BEACH domain-containing protein n=1 Tax=Heterodera trifolii TaxID=157864 RepID=A0ABD2JRH3_9BILA
MELGVISTTNLNEFIKELEQLTLQLTSPINESQFDKLFATISSNISSVIQNIVLQGPFFNFCLLLLRASDNDQFHQLMALLLDNYSPIFRSALTDIWVLLGDSADNIFGSLHSYFVMFRELQSIVDFSAHSKRVFADCVSLVVVCVDFLQTATMARQAKEVNKVAQLLSCLIVILIKGNAIKLRILHENFQRMLSSGSDPNVHLVLLRDLFFACSTQISSSFQPKNNEETVQNIAENEENISEGMAEGGEHSLKNEEKVPNTAKPNEGKATNTTQRTPPSLGVLQLFLIERLKFFCLSLESLNDQLELGLRSVSSCFTPFNFFTSVRLEKLIPSVFTIILTLHRPLNASQLTVTALLDIAEQLVLFYPQPKFLLEFFRLSMSDALMTQTICRSLRSLLEKCQFQPGEMLLFPQKQIMSSDPNECAIGESVAVLPTHHSLFSLEGTAATFKLDNFYNESGVTVSCWVRTIDKSSVFPLHILSLGNKLVTISAELVDTDSLRINIFRLHSSGLRSTVKDFFFQKIFRQNARFVHIALGLRIQEKCTFLLSVDNAIKKLEVPPLKAFAGSVGIAFGSMSCTESDQNNPCHEIYELSTVFGFDGILPPELLFVLLAVGPACFCFAECHHSSTNLSFSNCFSIASSSFSAHLSRVISQPKKHLTDLQRLLLFTVRPNFPHSFSMFDDHCDSNRIADELRIGPVEWKSEIVLNHVKTLDKSFRTIGGVKLFIFLYALTIDRSCPSPTQLESLRLLFLILRRDSSYYEQWKCPEEGTNSTSSLATDVCRFGPYLLARCLASRTAHLDEPIFQEIVCFIFSDILRNDHSEIVSTDQSVVQEPEFVQALIRYTDIWKGKNFTLWVHLVQILANCLSFSMAFDTKNEKCNKEKIRRFNLNQLQRSNFLHDFIFSLLDMLTNSHQFQLPSSIGSLRCRKKPSAGRKHSKAQSAELADDICRIIHQLIGGMDCEYNSEEIIQLWHFLLLSHPAKEAYLDTSIEPNESRSAWLNNGDDFEQSSTLISREQQLIGDEYKSELADFLEKLLQKHGRDVINNLWLELNGSVIALNQNLCFETCDNKKGTKHLNLLEEEKTEFNTEDRFDTHELLKTSCTTRKLTNPRPKVEKSETDQFREDKDISEVQQHQQLNIGPKEHWLVHVRVRLLRLMCELILNCDDQTIAHLEAKVLNWQTLLVLLSKQRFHQLRSLTFILLKNVFLRSSASFRQTFVNSHGFLLLCREMRGTSMDFSIGDALFSMTCGEHILLKNGLDIAHLEKLVFDPFKIASFSALFALLEESVEHPTLFWSVCSTLQKVFSTDSSPRQSMLQLGLVDSMANVLRSLCSLSTQREFELVSLFDCWLSFAQSILNCLVPYDDPFSYSSCEEFVWLCIIALWKDGGHGQFADEFGHRRPSTSSSGRTNSTSSSHSPDHLTPYFDPSFASSSNPLLRQALCQLLFCWIDSLRSTLSDQFRTPSSFSSLAASKRREMFGNRREYSSSAESSDFELVQSTSQWFPTADSSFGDFFRPHGFHSVASVFNPGFASNEENANRLLFSLTMVRNLFLFFDSPQLASEAEETLLATFLEILFCACCLSPRKASIKIDDWQNILRTKELRQSRENMSMLMELNLDFQYALKIGLHELCLLHFASIGDFDTDLDLLIKFMHSINIRSPLANLTLEEIGSLTADEILLLQQFAEIKNQFYGKMTERANAAWDRECNLLKFTSDQAITLTCEVAELQNVPRRLLVNWKKESQREWSRANRTLAHLVKELCHPEAPFFSPFFWPIGRVLNTTEGPSRERRRFSAAHYLFPLKFLKNERSKAVESLHNAPMPLDNLLNSGDIQQSHANGLRDMEDPIRMSISATLLRTAFECSGDLVISDQRLYFLGESAKSTQKGVVHAPVTYSWDYDQIKEMHIRFYQLKDTALELFTTTGDAFLVVFASEEDRAVILRMFRTFHLDKLFVDHKAQLKSATQMWRRGTLTNFEYLMVLNKLAGRTFNDLMQYPVFPFVLSDYCSDTLDIGNPSSYRNLTKPMAIQDVHMEKVYAQNYQSLAEEYDRFNQSADSGGSSPKSGFSTVRFGPYHYGSHYSNTGIVAHYLVRVPPYTSVALEYQDNNFDIPDRLFSSMDTTWRLSSSESTTDFKELIPEFFYLYEMLRNGDELELGVRQSGDQVDHVQVPPWCPRGDHRLFCLIHRHALESRHVTTNLHHWIDLIFGFKQNGENAVRAMNVFHPATYRGRDFVESNKDDPLIVCAIQTMIRTYGQMPLQLFDSPHLPHLNPPKCQNQQTTPKCLDPRPSVSVSAGSFREQFHSVVGVKWGDFVGSPEHDGFYFSTPSRFFTSGTKRSLRLSLVHCDQTTAICYGIPESTELIVCYRPDRKDPLRLNNELALCAVVAWGPSNFTDNVLRIKLVYTGHSSKRHFQLSPSSIDVPQQFWERLIDLQSLELCRVAYSSAANSLLLGFKCGLIRLYSLQYDQKWHCQLRSSLYAHSCAISSLSISDKFHVILSTSTDAKICLWDANKHNFERRFPPPPPVFNGSVPIEETVTLSCVSPTSADIAVVFQSGMSRLALYSINGELIGMHRERQRTITSIAMTDLPEGTAVNCVAIGLQSGMIRLIEMWTMTVVRDISFQSFHFPVLSLLFANESRRLYAAFANSNVVLCWQVPSLYGAASEEPMTTSRERPCFKVLNPFKCSDSFPL